MLRRLALGNAGGVKPTDAIALDFEARVIAAGGTLTASTLAAVDNLVKSYKKENIWNKKIDIGLFVGSNLAAALVKLKFPSGVQSTLTPTDFVEGDYSQASGLAGDGLTKALNTGVIPNTHIGDLKNLHVQVVGNNPSVLTGNTTVKVLVGSTTANNRLFMRHNTGAVRFEFNAGLAALVNVAYDPATAIVGTLLASTLGANNAYFFYNGTQVSTDTSFNAVTLGTDPVTIFAQSEDAVVKQHCNLVCRGYSLGFGLTPAEALKDSQIMAAFNAAVRV